MERGSPSSVKQQALRSLVVSDSACKVVKVKSLSDILICEVHSVAFHSVICIESGSKPISSVHATFGVAHAPHRESHYQNQGLPQPRDICLLG